MTALTLLAIFTAHRLGPDLPGLGWLEYAARDALMLAQAGEREDARLAIVDIDEDSLRLVGDWPWPRERMAELAERILSEAGATRVVLDLVMPAASPDSGDARLAALAQEHLLVLGQALDYEQRAVPVAVGRIGGGAGALGGAPPLDGQVLARATGHVGNHAGLSGSPCIGNIGVRPDADGKTRRVAPWTAYGGAAYPTLALAALDCGAGGGRAQALNPLLPVDAEGLWRVPFRHQARGHLAVPAHEVLQGTVDTEGGQALLAGRIVIVGSSALGLADRVATPVSANVSGVTVHAEALSWLLDLQTGRMGSRPPEGVMLAWALISALALGWSLCARASSLAGVAITALVMGLGWLALAAWVTRSGGVEPVTTPLLAMGVVLLTLLPLEWAGAQGQARRQARLLTRYVAPAVLAELQRDRTADVLAPRRAVITVLIADMQDYTRNTADAGLQEAARLTKGFLQALTEPVLAHRGTLDRYTGDGLVAFWGAPLPEPDHADLAVDAALEMVERVAAFNRERSSAGLAPVTVRVGLASGEALVGDLGTRFRIAYTAVGDCINLASRLQQASREVQVSILAADSVRLACRRHTFADLGTLAIRGLSDQRVGTPAGGSATPSNGAGDRARG